MTAVRWNSKFPRKRGNLLFGEYIMINRKYLFKLQLQSRKKLLRQCKRIKLNWKGPKISEIYFWVILGCYDQTKALFLEGRLSAGDIFDIFLIFSSFLSVKPFGNLFGKSYKTFVIPALLVANQTYSKMLCYFNNQFRDCRINSLTVKSFL